MVTYKIPFKKFKPEAGTEYQTHPAPLSSTSFSHPPNSHNSHSSEFKVVLKNGSSSYIQSRQLATAPLTTIPSVKLTINLPQTSVSNSTCSCNRWSWCPCGGCATHSGAQWARVCRCTREADHGPATCQVVQLRTSHYSLYDRTVQAVQGDTLQIESDFLET